jgi:hypothetical protein
LAAVTDEPRAATDETRAATDETRAATDDTTAATALGRPTGWLLGYPTDHLMGILPSPAASVAAVAGLVAAGVAPDAIRVMVGEAAALRIDGRGTHHGLLARLYRLVQFTQMDQAPDFRRYEQAARAGHPVVAVREADAARRPAIRAVLRAHGAHFTNFYGRYYSETLDPYEGPDEGDLPT